MHLEVKNLCFKFSSGFELKNVSFTVERGEKLCLLGPNGSGKTTLSRLLSGFIRPDSGDVIINGVSIFSMNHRQRAQKISFVPQLKQFEHGMKLLDFVLMGAYSREETLGILTKEAIELLDYFGLSHYLERTVDNLSSGELQKAVVAQTLLQNAEILVLDEPTAHLDIFWQKEILDKLIQLAEKSNKTLISILHDINLACSYFSRALVMSDGTLVYDGAVDDEKFIGILNSVFRVPLSEYTRENRKIFWYG